MIFPVQNEILLSELTILERLDRACALLSIERGMMSALMEVILPEPTDDEERSLPDSPTDALPGTEAKEAVLAERARKGQLLFHPDDATWPTGDDHDETAGVRNRNGSVRRKLCQEAMRNGASIVISYDPMEAAETLQRHFADDGLRAIVSAIWKESGVRASSPPEHRVPEGFVVVRDVARGGRRRKRREQAEGVGWKQLTIWIDDQAA